MICPYCGAELKDDAVFCHKCGKGVEPAIPETSETPETNNARVEIPLMREEPKTGTSVMQATEARKTLTTGVVSLAFAFVASNALSYVMELDMVAVIIALLMSILSIIAGFVCKKNVRNYQANYGPVTGMAKVGKILGIVGLVYGFVSLANSILVLIAGIMLMSQGLTLQSVLVWAMQETLENFLQGAPLLY